MFVSEQHLKSQCGVTRGVVRGVIGQRRVILLYDNKDGEIRGLRVESPATPPMPAVKTSPPDTSSRLVN